jgi:hypothetical protein
MFTEIVTSSLFILREPDWLCKIDGEFVLFGVNSGTIRADEASGQPMDTFSFVAGIAVAFVVSEVIGLPIGGWLDVAAACDEEDGRLIRPIKRDH